jgi:hypothetical protein
MYNANITNNCVTLRKLNFKRLDKNFTRNEIKIEIKIKLSKKNIIFLIM